ncbi:FecR protein [Pirellulimonas nuda]|uniref:FecR protein n=1 Tax=Pirellulimonas nuda TaxID=2528009 RepID=A0A518DH74_9BACT|nr:hypothetical protein [Pirellulimonas nuda]QDU90816.1 FecR protein [Pirellulimonas nuda]
MKHSDPHGAELVDLFSALEADLLTDEQCARLDALLAGSDEARSLYRKFIALHDDLYRMPLADLERLGSADVACVPDQAVATKGHSISSRTLMVVVGGLAASIAAAWFSFGSSTTALPALSESSPPGEDPSRRQRYVASLVGATDAEWSSPAEGRSVGGRLAAGVLQLESGSATIRFDSGGSLSLIGPARLIITGDSSATLEKGQVVFRSDGSGLHFALSTPNSELMHFGTEYAVLVAGTHEEIHVLEGEVHRLLDSQAVDHLESGQAKLFTGRAASEVQLSTTFFDRTEATTEDTHPRVYDENELIAVEPFDYDHEKPIAGQTASGAGWKRVWTIDGLPPQFEAKQTVDTDPALSTWGTHLRCDSVFEAYRDLERPLRMDRDGIYFLSCKFRFSATDPTKKSRAATSVVLVLRQPGTPDTPHYQEGLRFVACSSFLVASRRNQFSRLEYQLDADTTYCLVGKIISNRDGPDQLLARVVTEDELSSAREPDSWSVVSPEFFTDEWMERLTLRVTSDHATTAVDDIVVGETWEAVTSRDRR